MTATVTAPAAAVFARRTWWLAAIIAALLPLLFAALTHQVWEDYYITFRSSRNLVEGHGLVYHIGERVHTFTSPLGVLLPAAGFALTGHDGGALWFLRIASAAALAVTAVLLLAHAREHRWPAAACLLGLCLGAWEAKTVAFSANGMETAFVVLFVALAWRELTRLAQPRWPWLAVAFAGLMWTRPDGWVPAAAMGAAWWVFGPRSLAASERTWWRHWILGVVAAILLYAPWVVGTWLYYGSPVPQTIIAKSAFIADGFSWSRLAAAPLRCLVDQTAFDGLFAPIYANAGGWPRDFINTTRLLARLAALLWLVPSLPRATRAASLATLLGGVFLHQIMPYPWYYAPWAFLGGVALAGAAAHLIAAGSPRRTSLVRIVAGVIAGFALCTTAAQTAYCRVQQQLVEEGGRKQIGLWLRAHASPGDSVFLEPIGYIGYFSQLRIIDYPGLTAPRVSQLIHAGQGSYGNIIDALQPTWLVLRPSEIAGQRLETEGWLASYEPVARWDLHPQLEKRRFPPNRGWIEFDAEFVVFHRRQSQQPAEAQPQ